MALREGEDLFRQFSDASEDVFWVRDADTLKWQHLSLGFDRMYGLSREDVLRSDNTQGWLDLILPEDRSWVLENMRRVRGGASRVYECRIQRASDGLIRYIKNTDFPIRDNSGRVERIGGIAQDITDLRIAKERQRELLAELQHRVRNTWGAIRAMAQRTAESSESVADYAMHLIGRIDVCARVELAVTRSLSTGLTLAELVAEELIGAAAQEGEDATISGPDVFLRSRAAEILALVIHQLTTNAVKFGALGQEHGRIDVRWHIESEAETRQLIVIWTESGVPGVAAGLKRRGFGTDLMERTLACELNASAERSFERDGLRCVIRIPVSDRLLA